MRYECLLLQSPVNINQYDFLRDPIWQVIGVILAAIAIYLAIRQNQIKSLVYELNSSPIFRSHDKFKNSLKVTFNDKLVDNLTLVSVKFYNNGNVAIKKDDYSEDILLDFGDRSKVMDFQMGKQSPSDLKISIAINQDKSSIAIKPSLLNKKDSFTLMFVVSGYESMGIHARIIDIERIKKVTDNKAIDLLIAQISFLLIETTIIFGGIALSTFVRTININPVVFVGIILFMSCALSIIINAVRTSISSYLS